MTPGEAEVNVVVEKNGEPTKSKEGAKVIEKNKGKFPKEGGINKYFFLK